MASDAEFRDGDRIRLITELNSLLARPGETYMLPPTQWAALWLSDLSQLGSLINLLKDYPQALPLVDTDSLTDFVLKPWNQRVKNKKDRSGRNSPRVNPPTSPTHHRVASLQETGEPEDLLPIRSSGSTASTSSGANLPRSERVKKACLQRDDRACILTQIGQYVEVAHIYPYSMNTIPDDGLFWKHLSTFWSQEKIDTWKNAIFTENSTEIVENVVTLCPNAHVFWTNAVFALKPLDVSEDGKSMDVQFFWLRQYCRLPSTALTTPPQLPSNEAPVNNIGLFNHKTRREICSGDIITLRTDDPHKRPLPSKELLEMQWVLHRLSALTGGAEAAFDHFDPDNDAAPDYIYMEDELEDSSDMDRFVQEDTYWANNQIKSWQGNVQTVS